MSCEHFLLSDALRYRTLPLFPACRQCLTVNSKDWFRIELLRVRATKNTFWIWRFGFSRGYWLGEFVPATRVLTDVHLTLQLRQLHCILQLIASNSALLKSERPPLCWAQRRVISGRSLARYQHDVCQIAERGKRCVLREMRSRV